MANFSDIKSLKKTPKYVYFQEITIKNRTYFLRIRHIFRVQILKTRFNYMSHSSIGQRKALSMPCGFLFCSIEYELDLLYWKIFCIFDVGNKKQLTYT